VTTLPVMTYDVTETRQALLDTIADAIDQLAVALAALGGAYELLDESNADLLEEHLFGPVQKAYGRAQRTHAAFAQRYDLPGRTFEPAIEGAPSTGVAGFVEAAVEAVIDADQVLADLQDSLAPIEVGDPELRASLSEVRRLVAGVESQAARFVSARGR
jgi:hypothetical protein